MSAACAYCKGFEDTFQRAGCSFFCIRETDAAVRRFCLLQTTPGYIWRKQRILGTQPSGQKRLHCRCSTVSTGTSTTTREACHRMEYPVLHLVNTLCAQLPEQAARIDYHHACGRTTSRRLQARPPKPIILCGDLSNPCLNMVEEPQPRLHAARRASPIAGAPRASWASCWRQASWFVPLPAPRRCRHVQLVEHALRAHRWNAGWRIDYFLVSNQRPERSRRPRF